MNKSNIRKIHDYKIEKFLGYDFSSNPVNVSPQRAMAGKNFWKKNDITQKRAGWKQVAEFGTNQVNGIYKYSSTDYIVYAGTKFYKLVFTTTHYTVTEITLPSGVSLVDRRCQFFKNGDYIFIVGCGDFLVFYEDTSTWYLKRVEDWDDVYIPTTTISIDYEGYSGTAKLSTLERPNLITNKRKNTMRGVEGSGGSGGTQPATTTFVLDSSIYVPNTLLEPSCATITIERINSSDEYELITYNAYYDGTVGQATIKDSLDVTVGTLYSNDGVTAGTAGKIVLNYDNTEPPTNDDNITIEFKAIGVDFDATVITEQVFGTLFGVDGQANQLFLAGKSNVDYFSYPNNFTYWPDDNYKQVGISTGKIRGYLKLNDQTLCIFKEKEGRELSAYIRTGAIQTNEESVSMNAVFTDTMGLLGEELTNIWATENFLGDSVFLSKNGLKAIELQENLATNQRISVDRSTYVNRKLKNSELSDAYVYAHNEKLYVVIGTECYVCDRKYITAIDGRIEYEWFYLTNIPARVMFSDDDDLYFGTTDGRLCMFDDKYTDRTFEVIESGNMSFHPSDDTIYYNHTAYTPIAGTKLKFEDPTLYEMYFNIDDVSDITGNTLTIPNTGTSGRYNNLNLITEGDEVILVGDDETNPQTVYISNIDTVNMTVDLVDNSGDAVNISTFVSSQMFILNSITGTELIITNIVLIDDYFQLKKYDDGEPIEFIFYEGASIDDSTNTNIPIIVITTTNVSDLWITPYLDLGSYNTLKTLTDITMLSIIEDGDLTIGYETKNNIVAFDYLFDNPFAFDNIDFTDFTFKGFAETYTKKVRERNFNYIAFKFSSNSAGNSSITKFIASFQYNNKSRGAR